MKDARQIYLEEELAAYEAETSMSKDERRELRDWVRSGHSVHESPGSRYMPGYGELQNEDFLDAYRDDTAIDEALEGLTDDEQLAWLKENFGVEVPEEPSEPTTSELKECIRTSERELFFLWGFISSKGLYNEANEYVTAHFDDPIPFEYE